MPLDDFESRGWARGCPGVKCREPQLTIGVLTLLLDARRVYSGFAAASTRGESARTETRWKIPFRGCAGNRRKQCAWDQAIGCTRVCRLPGSAALARQDQGLHCRRGSGVSISLVMPVSVPVIARSISDEAIPSFGAGDRLPGTPGRSTLPPMTRSCRVSAELYTPSTSPASGVPGASMV